MSPSEARDEGGVSRRWAARNCGSGSLCSPAPGPGWRPGDRGRRWRLGLAPQPHPLVRLGPSPGGAFRCLRNSESWKRRRPRPLSQVGNDALIRSLSQAVPTPPRPLLASPRSPPCLPQAATCSLPAPLGATHCLVGLATSTWGRSLGRVAVSRCLEGEPRFRGSGVLGSGTGAGGRSFT